MISFWESLGLDPFPRPERMRSPYIDEKSLFFRILATIPRISQIPEYVRSDS